MNVLSRYILKKFILYFFSIFLVFLVFVSVINILETTNILIKKSQEFSIESLLQIPYYLYLITPMITILAAFVTLNYFISTNEYKAVYAGGYSRRIFLYPLIFFSFVIIFISIFVVDELSTFLYRKSENLDSYKFSDLFIKRGDVVFGVKEIISPTRFRDIYLEKISKKKMIKAEELIWDGNIKKWIVKTGIIRDDNIKISSFSSITIDFLSPPEDIIIEKISDGNIYSIYELIKRIKKLSLLSIKYDCELVFIFFKLSLIFTNLSGVIIAFIFFQTDIIKNKAVSISFAIISSFFMWFILVSIKRIADLGIIKPYFVLILPHLLFITTGWYLGFRKRSI